MSRKASAVPAPAAPAPAARTRVDGPRSKRGVILDAAVDSFGELGFEHTKWAAIADQVGIGQTALYHYFESKHHCLLTIMTTELERSLDRFREATAGVPDETRQLRLGTRSAFAVSPREALAARILINHLDLLSGQRNSAREEEERQRARVLVRAIEDEWTDLVRRGIASGAFAKRDARQTALALLGLMLSVWRWYRPGGSQSLDDITDFIADACVRLVGP
jgi:TetR/AcrR family transcriptional regulator, cholesterol catabolism regulator